MNAYTILNSQFTVFTDAETGKKLAKCNYCEAMLKYHHSTTSLTYHLRCKHAIGAAIVPNRNKQILSSAASAVKSESTLDTNQHVNTYIDRVTNLPPVNNIDNQLALWIAKDARPLDIVEDNGLKELLNTAAGSRTIELPSREIISSHLEYIFHRERLGLKELITQSPYVALTTDSWTNGGDNFSSIRCHYISPCWKLQSALLDIEHSADNYTSVIVNEHLSSLASQWQIEASDKVTHMVLNSLSPLNDLDITFERTPCFATLLQLCVHNAMVACNRDDNIDNDILSYYNCYVEVDPVKHSRTILKLAQIPLNQEICTLWRRTFLMAECLLRNKRDVTNQPSAEEWAEFFSVHKLFEPLENAIRILGGERYTTASSILPLIAYLKQQMTAADTDSPYIHGFKKVFLSQFNSRIESIQDSEDLALAVSLDIRYKRLLSIPSEKRATVWTSLKSVVRLMVDSTGSGEPNAKKPRSSLLSLAGDEEVGEEDDTSLPEFEMYRHLPQISDDDQCPLLWWKQYESTYPVLSQIAKRYLSIPATSVPCEQLFSDAGEKLNRKRCALPADEVGTILCLSDWLAQDK